MEVHWDDRLLKAAFGRARLWASENPIKYSVIFGLPAIALQVAIFAGVLRMSDPVMAGVSLVVVPAVLVGFMIARTLLLMLYEVRTALGKHIDPALDKDAENFTCELAELNSNEIAMRITNHGAAADFYAKVVDISGVDRSPVPISVQWRSDRFERKRRISRGDSELLTVARVRGRRAIDFLQPRSINKDGYLRVAANNGSEGPATPSVAAQVRVFNQQSDTEGQRTHVLRLTFDNGADIPTVEFGPANTEH